MTNSEKLLQFKQLYVSTNTLYLNIEELLSPNKLNVQDVDQIVVNIDEMISLLPISLRREECSLPLPLFYSSTPTILQMNQKKKW